MLFRSINWLVNDKNVVKTTPDGFNIQNFDINNQEQQIKINNETAAVTSPLLVNISNFQLKTITAAMNEDSLSVDGLLNADLKVTDLKNAIPTMDGRIKVDSIVFQKISIGNLDVAAQSQNSDVKLNGKLVGNGNQVDLVGTYSANTIDAPMHRIAPAPTFVVHLYLARPMVPSRSGFAGLKSHRPSARPAPQSSSRCSGVAALRLRSASEFASGQGRARRRMYS